VSDDSTEATADEPPADRPEAATPTGVIAPPEPAPLPEGVFGTIPPISSTRGLLGASFDLLTRAGPEMRRASFYVGAVVLGTVGPLVLASWAIEVIALDRSDEQMGRAFERGGGVDVAILVAFTVIGLLVAAVESRNLAVAILGGRIVDRPVTLRQALARSRSVFWRSVVAAIIVGIPIAIVQTAAESVAESVLGPDVDVSIVISTLAAAIVGAPLAYVLAGVVLGDVDPLEALRRSLRVFLARKSAAALVAGFETVAILLILVGLSAGLDIVLRVLDALGLGPDAGPVGLALMTVLIVATVFAGGTLLFTVYAITVAPQVVMFVGLTHATMGLDHVRPGGWRRGSGRRT